MNVIEAKQWINSNAHLIDSPLKRHPHRLTVLFKRCIILFSFSNELSYRERIQWLSQLENVIVLSGDSGALIARVQKVMRTLKKVEKKLSAYNESERQMNFRFKELSKKLFVHHAVLDSVYKDADGVEGMSCLSALQIFLDELHLWNQENPSAEMKHLTWSFEALEELMFCLITRSTVPKLFFHAYGLQFLQKTHSLLNLLSQGKIPYFFLPVQSQDHAMIGRVEWSYEQGYQLTIINTTSLGGYFDEKATYESIYEGLSQEEMMSVSQSLLMLWKSPDDVYRGIENQLPLNKKEARVGKSHGIQKGNSCSVKSLTAAMHSTLHEKNYRAFKAFYTKNLLDHSPDFPKLEAAYQILAKRTKKSLN